LKSLLAAWQKEYRRVTGGIDTVPVERAKPQSRVAGVLSHTVDIGIWVNM